MRGAPAGTSLRGLRRCPAFSRWRSVGPGALLRSAAARRARQVTGTRYGYRLSALSLAGGADEVVSPESWVQIPEAPPVAFSSLGPNPSHGSFEVSFDLRDQGAASIDILDIAGRIRVSRAVGYLGAGRHTLELAGPNVLAPGLYFLRVQWREGSVSQRRVVIR